MEKKKLLIKLKEKDLKNMVGRYHFRDTDLPRLQQVYEDVFQESFVSVFFKEDYGDKKETAVLMTLGSSVDAIQSCLMEEEKLSESYMIECLSMEILAGAYRELDALLLAKSGRKSGGYSFPGADTPIETVAEIVDSFQQELVTYNEQFMLIPKKSVAYLIKRTGEKSLCAGCSNISCENRENQNDNHNGKELNYGYQRIFGKRGNDKCKRV